tara:strand:- start:439 stop:1230 length:792 start_codon:yes stop_codon:yes gene_type:complete
VKNPKRIKGAGATLLAVIVTSGIAATALAERQYSRMTTDEAWIVTGALEVGHIMTAGDLQIASVDQSVAQLALNNPNAIIGRQLVNNKNPGDIISQGDLKILKKLGMTDVIPEGRVVFTLAPDAQLQPYLKQLRTGDNFDILVTRPGGQVTLLAADVLLLGNLQNEELVMEDPDTEASILSAAVKIANPVSSNRGSGLLILAVKPEDVYPLASSVGSGGMISIIAHRTQDVAEARLAVKPPPTLSRTIEVYEGLEKANVSVRR